MAGFTLEAVVLGGVSRVEKLNAGTCVLSYPVDSQAPADPFFMRHPSLRLVDSDHRCERAHNQRNFASVRAGRPAGGTGASPTRSPLWQGLRPCHGGVVARSQTMPQRWEGRPELTAAWRLTRISGDAAATVAKASSKRPPALAKAMKRQCATATRTPSASRREWGF
jgi:hypothetical protein